MISYAVHGRMRLSRCLSTSINVDATCKTDVKLYVERRCAGRRQCAGVDTEVEGVNGHCVQEVRGFLEVEYSCLPGETSCNEYS